MGLDNKKSSSNDKYKTWLFLEGLLDVIVSCLYRVLVSLNDILRLGKLRLFILKVCTYFFNKLARYYVKYFDQKKNKNQLGALWPVVSIGILVNLIFDFSFNFFLVLRSLNNKISWLSNIAVLGLAYAYMVLSSAESFYVNSVSWYGILNGGFDDTAFRAYLNVFFVCVGLLEAIISSLYFIVTTNMTLLYGAPICFLLYFLPPFLQKYVDASVITNCVTVNEEATFKSSWYKLIAYYVVIANVLGLCFQISSFIANIASGLPWLTPVMVMHLSVAFVAFFVLHTLLTNGYTWAQYLFGVNFLGKGENLDLNTKKSTATGSNELNLGLEKDTTVINKKNNLEEELDPYYKTGAMNNEY